MAQTQGADAQTTRPDMSKQNGSNTATNQPKSAPSSKEVTALSGKQLYELKKKVASAERKIDSLEKEQLELAQKLEHLTYGAPDFTKSYDSIEQAKKDLVRAMSLWEELSAELKKHSA